MTHSRSPRALAVRATLLLTGLVALMGVAGCSSPAASATMGAPPPEDDAGAPAADAGSAAPLLRVLPTAAFSGFDGTHTFRVPIAVYGASDATLTASDPSMVTIAPAKLTGTVQDNGVYFMVTTRKAGTVTLTATARGATVTSSFTATPYTVDQYATGEARYTTSSTSGPACQSCHYEGGGIDHSPSQMASAKDGDVVSVITAGVLVDGNPITQIKHKWAVTDAESAGLVSYLRALTPRGFDGVQ